MCFPMPRLLLKSFVAVVAVLMFAQIAWSADTPNDADADTQPAEPAAPSPEPVFVPYKVPALLPDVLTLSDPQNVVLGGYLGSRAMMNVKNRLRHVTETELFDDSANHSGGQLWSGACAGEYLSAATLAWVEARDGILRRKIDREAKALLATQESDGYFSACRGGRRWEGWDIWAHAEAMSGLLTYYQYTGDASALAACQKCGDLLCATFGDGKTSILSAGDCGGLTATSILGPIVLLYRTTGDVKYLDLGRSIAKSLDVSNGPGLISGLLRDGRVNLVGGGAVLPILANLIGLCEFARATGDRTYLQPVLKAWDDIESRRLYITGTTGVNGLFGSDYELPNDPRDARTAVSDPFPLPASAKRNQSRDDDDDESQNRSNPEDEDRKVLFDGRIGETCATVAWIDLNVQLLRLVGHVRFANEIERSYYNHLTAAQQPDGKEWCRYTPLMRSKFYTKRMSCDLACGPRSLSLLPELAYLRFHSGKNDGIAVNFLETCSSTMVLGGREVHVSQVSDFPRQGSSLLVFRMDAPAVFGLGVRSPLWSSPLRLQVLPDGPSVIGDPGGWAEIQPREWRPGERVRIEFNLGPRVIPGEHGDSGLVALAYGPFVFAEDEEMNWGLPAAANIQLAPVDGQALAKLDPYHDLRLKVMFRVQDDLPPREATLVPFAEAGVSGKRFAVWLHGPGSPVEWESVLARGQESRSRWGDGGGSTIDGDPETCANTYSWNKAIEDWFAVSLEAPVTIKRIVYCHGRCRKDGGWFDTTAGKPRIQVRREKNGAWEDVGVLADYPNCTAELHAPLAPGQPFTLILNQPAAVFGVRVVGTPSCGDSDRENFVSCGELEAFPN